MSRISKTRKGYKLTISKNHQLDKRSLPELNSIIEAYQSSFSIPEDYEDGKDDIEYWEELLDCSKDAIQNATQTLEKIHDQYEEAIKKAKINIEKGIRPEKNIRQLAQKLTLTLNIGKTHFSAHILIISHTFIEAIRLSERALLDISCVSFEIATYIKNLLRELNITIAKTIDDFDEGVYKFSQHTGYNADLDRTENSFGLILEDYTANLKSINSIITKLLKDLDNSNRGI